MRFYHMITLALAIICLSGHSGLGAPAASTKGNYMWVECKPDGKNANCLTKKGPLIPLDGQRTRLPPSAAKDIVAVSAEEATPDTEDLSGDGSGDSDNFPVLASKKQPWRRDAPEQDIFKNEEEGSTTFSGDIDYSEYVSTQKVNWLSEEDLKEENIIA
ncbi:serglycin precursor [Danio rerio]|uniref:Serglycin n=1 Tax=Danio rerio TaxID=7955 RepID=B8A5H9_DANRE|nr:serglycin precursor [Danio rerio]|eukprot:NP_001165083.1 serglycin precursor [Danio rerio]